MSEMKKSMVVDWFGAIERFADGLGENGCLDSGIEDVDEERKEECGVH